MILHPREDDSRLRDILCDSYQSTVFVYMSSTTSHEFMFSFNKPCQLIIARHGNEL